ncbi:LppU/SCO3897 family protein [Streptomyces sp. 12297]
MTTPPPPAPEQPLAPAEPVPTAEPAKKKSNIGKKALGIVIAIALALFWKLGLPYLTGDAPVRAEVGDCVTVTGPENDPDVTSKGCTEKVADLYKVVKVIDDTFDVDKCGTVAEVALAQQLESYKFVLCMNPVKN